MDIKILHVPVGEQPEVLDAVHSIFGYYRQQFPDMQESSLVYKFFRGFLSNEYGQFEDGDQLATYAIHDDDVLLVFNASARARDLPHNRDIIVNDEVVFRIWGDFFVVGHNFDKDPNYEFKMRMGARLMTVASERGYNFITTEIDEMSEATIGLSDEQIEKYGKMFTLPDEVTLPFNVIFVEAGKQPVVSDWQHIIKREAIWATNGDKFAACKALLNEFLIDNQGGFEIEFLIDNQGDEDEIEYTMPFDDKVMIACGRLGKVVGLPHNRDIVVDGKVTDYIAGNFYILGLNDEGEAVGLSDELIEKYTKIFALPEIIAKEGELYLPEIIAKEGELYPAELELAECAKMAKFWGKDSNFYSVIVCPETPDDLVEAVKYADFTISLAEFADIHFFYFQFGDYSFNGIPFYASINYDYEGYGFAGSLYTNECTINIILVDATTGKVRAIRSAEVDSNLSYYLRLVIEKQDDTFNEATYKKVCEALPDLIPFWELLLIRDVLVDVPTTSSDAPESIVIQYPECPMPPYLSSYNRIEANKLMGVEDVEVEGVEVEGAIFYIVNPENKQWTESYTTKVMSQMVKELEIHYPFHVRSGSEIQNARSLFEEIQRLKRRGCADGDFEVVFFDDEGIVVLSHDSRKAFVEQLEHATENSGIVAAAILEAGKAKEADEADV
jgi:hypothetical protein